MIILRGAACEQLPLCVDSAEEMFKIKERMFSKRERHED